MSLNKNILEEKVRREFLRLNCIKVCKKSENSQSTKKMIISSRLAGKLKHYSRHCCQKLSFNIKESTTSWNQFLFSWLCTFNFIKYALNFRASLLYEAAKKVTGLPNRGPLKEGMIPNWLHMSSSDSLDYPGSILYRSESSEVPYSTNQYLTGQRLSFAVSYSKPALVGPQFWI